MIINSKYKIIQDFKSGAFSTVYEVEDVKTKKHWALKVTNFEKFDTDEIQKIQRETELLKNIQHNNIVQFLETFFESNSQFTVMPILKPIEDLNINSLTDEDRYLVCKKMAIDLMAALKYLSNVEITNQTCRGVVHRDIKADNVMIRMEENDDFSTVLIDFNAARALPQFQAKLTIDVGNIYHRAPECWGDDPQYSTASDLWAVGILLFELATKSKAYQQQNHQQMQRAIKQGKVKQVPECVEAGLKLLISNLLSPDTEVRIQAMNTFLEDNKDLVAVRTCSNANIPIAKVQEDLKGYEVLQQFEGTNYYKLEKNNVAYSAVRISKTSLSTQKIQAIKREKGVLQNLNFKFIFNIIEVVESDDAVYKIYPEFKPLHLSLENNQSFYKSDATLMLDVFLLLRFLQMNQIYLKNIQPANFVTFIQEDSLCASIIDFSYSNIVTQDVPETSKYHAPEVWKDGTFSMESDVWSVGICCYEFVSKQDAYQGRSQTDIQSGFIQEFPESIPKLNQSLIKPLLLSHEKRGQSILHLLQAPQIRPTLIQRIDEQQFEMLINNKTDDKVVKHSQYIKITNLVKTDSIYPIVNGKNIMQDGSYVVYSKFTPLQRNQNSSVYECEDQTTKNSIPVVMKIQDIYNRDDEQVAKITQEMKITPNHKNIIQVFRSFIEEQNDHKYVIVVMEKGTTFEKFFASGMKLQDLVKVIKDCCCGLLYMLGENPDKYGCYIQDGVKQQFIHRDIKPANIIIRGTADSWSAALIDFNACKQLAIQSKPKTYIGTDGFIAPEIENLDDGRYYTKACDVYSLGKTIEAWMTMYNIYNNSLLQLVGTMTRTLPKNRPTLEQVLEQLDNLTIVPSNVIDFKPPKSPREAAFQLVNILRAVKKEKNVEIKFQNQILKVSQQNLKHIPQLFQCEVYKWMKTALIKMLNGEEIGDEFMQFCVGIM